MKKQNGYKGQKTNLLSLPSLSLSVQFPKNKPITRSVKCDSKLKQNYIRGLSIIYLPQESYLCGSNNN